MSTDVDAFLEAPIGPQLGARCAVTRWPGGIPPHDPRLPKEREPDRLARHRLAVQECLRCPLLEACEAYLSDQERSGVRVVGVIAGRYSDRSSHVVGEMGESQGKCRQCGSEMMPQKKHPNHRELPLQHQGEGLCNLCWPRWARVNRPTSHGITHSPNNPFRERR